MFYRGILVGLVLCASQFGLAKDYQPACQPEPGRKSCFVEGATEFLASFSEAQKETLQNGFLDFVNEISEVFTEEARESGDSELIQLATRLKDKTAKIEKEGVFSILFSEESKFFASFHHEGTIMFSLHPQVYTDRFLSDDIVNAFIRKRVFNCWDPEAFVFVDPATGSIQKIQYFSNCFREGD